MPLGPPKRFDRDKLKDYALRLLAARALSKGELRQRLRRHAATPEDADAVLAQLEEYGLTDDRRFAEHFSETRAQSGAHGRQRVLTDLLRKRVQRPVAEAAVREAFAGTDEPAQVEAWIQRKFRGKELAEYLSDPRRLQSAYRRLRLAGFSSPAVLTALKRHTAAPHVLEDMEAADDGESGPGPAD
jgi:regulatory protein